VPLERHNLHSHAERGNEKKRETRTIQIRAELEVLIAKHLYQLTIQDWEYLTSTFTYGNDSVTKQELDKIIDTSKRIFA
jgi:hypothetical protein